MLALCSTVKQIDILLPAGVLLYFY